MIQAPYYDPYEGLRRERFVRNWWKNVRVTLKSLDLYKSEYEKLDMDAKSKLWEAELRYKYRNARPKEDTKEFKEWEIRFTKLQDEENFEPPIRYGH